MNEYTFFKYINEKSMLVITPQKQLKRLYCPFPVRDALSKIHNVTSIASDNDFKIYYLINGKHSLHSEYKIMS